MVLFVIGLAIPAFSLADDFSSYASHYRVLDNTSPQGWVPAYDAISIQSDSLHKNGDAAFRTNVDVSRHSSQRASVHTNLSSQNLGVYKNRGGMMYLWFKPSVATHLTDIRVRLGSDASNYFEYITTQPYNISYFVGAQLVPFDLEAPSSVVGRPSIQDIRRVQVLVYYTAAQPDFAFTINQIWVEKGGNAFGANWVVPFFGGRPDGWALPYVSMWNNGMSLTDNDILSLGHHGRVFYRREDSSNKSAFTVETDVKIVNAAWGSRLFFDFIDGFNFSGVFLTNQWQKAGIEYWQNGVRSYRQIPFTIIPGQTYRVKYEVNNRIVKLFINGAYLLSYTLPSRRTGELGMESFQGTSHFSAFNFLPA
ncbi:MAG: hypothetical protein Q8P05_04050 [Candidatus Diapherotrites archaeon]|nr:hypothetical protein [Candidatus Diapherotrites archaeon]